MDLRGAIADVRYGVRRLVATPVPTLMAIVTLAAGIAVNATTFSIANTVLLTPLAAHDPDRLVAVFASTDRGAPYRSSSFPEYRDLEAQSTEVPSDLAAFGVASADLQDDRRTHAAMAARPPWPGRGLPCAIGTGVLGQGFLFGVSAFDAVAYIRVAMTLAAVGLAAVAIPAWRATRIEPVDALKSTW